MYKTPEQIISETGEIVKNFGPLKETYVEYLNKTIRRAYCEACQESPYFSELERKEKESIYVFEKEKLGSAINKEFHEREKQESRS